MNDCYQGIHVCVRKIRKRDGRAGYVLHRSNDRAAVLDEFSTRVYANLVAQYIDGSGGAYVASVRKAARKFADGQMLLCTQ